MRRTIRILLLLALGAAVEASEFVQYTEEDGTIKIAEVASVRKDEEDDFHVRILVGGRRRTLKIPSRRVISFRRGDADAKNAWSNQLARGKRFLAAGRLATQGTNPGAEEVFTKVAYTTEEGVKGQEALFAASPWHNMYALYYLIETRLAMGKAGDKAKLEAALSDCDQFYERSGRRKTLDWDVPGEKGMTRRQEVWCWGDTRLTPKVMLLHARILHALGRKAEALAKFDEVIDRCKKKNLSPLILRDAYLEKAEAEVEGAGSEQQEKVFRDAGTVLASLARTQPDAFGKETLKRAANQALLRGADFLLESAQRGKFSWDSALSRYRQLKDSEGRRDPALAIGAQTGIGVCLVEKKDGAEGYEALLDVVVRGSDYPDHMARALYYLGRAARLFADEIESGGGKGDFLRSESERWWTDLKQRYPSSDWARKAQEQ